MTSMVLNSYFISIISRTMVTIRVLAENGSPYRTRLAGAIAASAGGVDGNETLQMFATVQRFVKYIELETTFASSFLHLLE